MKLQLLAAVTVILLPACRNAPEPSAAHGYRGIEKVELLAKGME